LYSEVLALTEEMESIQATAEEYLEVDRFDVPRSANGNITYEVTILPEKKLYYREREHCAIFIAHTLCGVYG